MSGAGGISIHAVDVATGRPASGLNVRLLKVTSVGAEIVAEGRCNPAGLFDHPTVRGDGITEGEYSAEFDVGIFHAAQSQGVVQPMFLNVVRYDFRVEDAKQHYHLPFKFTRWGYSLFRGGL